MMDYEWQKTTPIESGWWWLKFGGPAIIVEVEANRAWGVEAGEVRLPGDRHWKDLVKFKDCTWAGPLYPPDD